MTNETWEKIRQGELPIPSRQEEWDWKWRLYSLYVGAVGYGGSYPDLWFEVAS